MSRSMSILPLRAYSSHIASLSTMLVTLPFSLISVVAKYLMFSTMFTAKKKS